MKLTIKHLPNLSSKTISLFTEEESKFELCRLGQFIEEKRRHSSSFKLVIKAFFFVMKHYVSAKVLYLRFACPWFLTLVFAVLILYYTSLLCAPLLFPPVKPCSRCVAVAATSLYNASSSRRAILTLAAA